MEGNSRDFQSKLLFKAGSAVRLDCINQGFVPSRKAPRKEAVQPFWQPCFHCLTLLMVKMFFHMYALHLDSFKVLPSVYALLKKHCSASLSSHRAGLLLPGCAPHSCPPAAYQGPQGHSCSGQDQSRPGPAGVASASQGRTLCLSVLRFLQFPPAPPWSV